ncbi:MAG: tetratricopeptide repeat protein [Acidobacteria bacterium]|nr:tetratricopeptide repeat protein [Acidobacteriota bacterium]
MQFVLILLISALFALAAGQEYEKARILFEKTDYPASTRVLEAVQNKTGADWNLLGRNYFMMGEYKKATDTFEKATSLDPRNSSHWHWLGRTYGRRAELASFLSAPGYASKARQNFERAVELDVRNIEALNDLFEYYLQAPGFLGGGLDKAQALIEKIAAVDPVERHWAMARVAEEKKDFKTAEAQLRRSMEMAPKQIGRIVDLAKFLAKRGRTQESEQIFEQARKIEPSNPTYLWERANLLIEQKRNLPEARQLLEQYMNSKVKPDDDHKEEARKLLSKIQGA